MESDCKIRKAVIEDMDKLIRLRLDYLIADQGNLKAEDKAAIELQLVNYITKNLNQNFIAYFAEVDYKVVSIAFLVISEKPANPSFIELSATKEGKPIYTKLGFREVSTNYTLMKVQLL